MVLSIFEKEKISNEKRFWLRTTRTCNNHCIFCHDSEIQNGEIIGVDTLKTEIKKAKADGFTRLILSGGEPTIHPDIISLVDYAKMLGFDWIQLISNGRMFAYRDFTSKIVRAGLNEVTISFHSHEKKISDYLTGVRGSYEQTIKGIENLKRNNIVISIDIVINKLNYRHLTESIKFFYSTLNITEFDLLHLTPFGRGLENYNILNIEPESERREIKKAIRYAQKNKIVLWTNRVPPEILEGNEEYIQDPHKILDEIYGRSDIFNNYLENGLLECRSKTRCEYCFVRDFCEYLINIKTIYLKRKIDRLLIDYHQTEKDIENLFDHILFNATIITTPEILKEIRAEIINSRKELIIKTENLNNLEEIIKMYQPSSIISSNSKILSLSGLKKIFILTNKNIKYLNNSTLLKRVELLFPNAENLIKETEEVPDIKTVMNTVRKYQLRVSNLPVCISGNFFRNNPFTFKANFISRGRFDLDRIAKEFLLNHNYHKSLRCKSCIHMTQCEGIHINHIRRFGFKILRPVKL